MSEFTLSASLPANRPVRDVAVADGLLCVLEERGQVHIFESSNSTNEYTRKDVMPIPLHTKGLAFDCKYIPGNAGFDTPVFITGGNDKIARSFTQHGNPLATLEGHTDCVNCITQLSDGCLVTGSWDGTARVWNKSLQTELVLKGHTHAVEVVGLQTGEIVTASASKNIIIYRRDGTVIKTINNAHSDPIRQLCLHPLGFMSCGNDGFVKVWSQTGEPLISVPAHASSEVKFVYGIATLASGEIVSCGEDSKVQVWAGDGSKLIQTIGHPAPVKSVAVLANGDVVTACADSMTRIFTRDPARYASSEAQSQYKDFVNLATLSGVEEVDTSKMPKEDVLLKPGPKDGHVQPVNVSGKGPIAFKWVEDEMLWVEIGQIVGKPKEKRKIGDKTYDHVTDVYVDEQRSVSLGYNVDEDPVDVATNFCNMYGLGVDARAQIIGHLTPLCNREALAKRVANDKQLKAATELKHIPSWVSGGFQMFAPIKTTAFHSKMLELSDSMEGDALSDKQKATLGELVATLEEPNKFQSGVFPTDQAELIEFLVMRWPSAKILPVLDAVRALMMHSDACKQISSNMTLMEKILWQTNQGKATHKTLVLKILANWVAKREKLNCERATPPTVPPDALSLLEKSLEEVASAIQSDNEKTFDAYIMFTYNVVTWLGRMGLDDCDFYLVMVAAIIEILNKHPKKEKMVFYALLTIGTIGHCSASGKVMIQESFEESLIQLVRHYRLSDNTALKEVCEDIARVFTLS